jgi:universal stress protein A
VIEIRSIMAPTDFSAHSEESVRYACGLAERLGAVLHLVHILSEVLPVGPDPLLMPVMPPEYYQENEVRAKESLDRLLDPGWGTPRSVITEVRWGSPVEAIVSYAVDHPIDLIVIATHGRTGLSHVLLGSVAERIVREAPCPVLTIRDRHRGPALLHSKPAGEHDVRRS